LPVRLALGVDLRGGLVLQQEELVADPDNTVDFPR